MSGEGRGQHLDELAEQAEAALTRLDAPLAELAMDRLHDVRHLALEHRDRPAGGRGRYRGGEREGRGRGEGGGGRGGGEERTAERHHSHRPSMMGTRQG